MRGVPLRYARRNILVGPGGEAAALYRADTTAYPFLPTAEKWALLFRLERFAHLAAADFSVWRVQRAYPAERYPEELEGLFDAAHGDPEGWRRYLAGHEDRLRRLGSHVPEVYVAVSLAEAEGGPGALRSFGRVRRRIEELAGVGAPRPISGAELEALAAAEQRTFDRLSGAIALQRASTRELQWLLRRAACRGVAEPALEECWQPDALVVVSPNGGSAYEPLEHDLWPGRQRARDRGPRRATLARGRGRGGHLLPGASLRRPARRGSGVPRRRRASLRSRRRRGDPRRRGAPRGVGRQPRGARAGPPPHPRRRARLPRAA